MATACIAIGFILTLLGAFGLFSTRVVSIPGLGLAFFMLGFLVGLLPHVGLVR